jgi:hypothetical protein
MVKLVVDKWVARVVAALLLVMAIVLRGHLEPLLLVLLFEFVLVKQSFALYLFLVDNKWRGQTNWLPAIPHQLLIFEFDNLSLSLNFFGLGFKGFQVLLKLFAFGFLKDRLPELVLSVIFKLKKHIVEQVLSLWVFRCVPPFLWVVADCSSHLVEDFTGFADELLLGLDAGPLVLPVAILTQWVQYARISGGSVHNAAII